MAELIFSHNRERDTIERLESDKLEFSARWNTQELYVNIHIGKHSLNLNKEEVEQVIDRLEEFRQNQVDWDPRNSFYEMDLF